MQPLTLFDVPEAAPRRLADDWEAYVDNVIRERNAYRAHFRAVYAERHRKLTAREIAHRLAEVKRAMRDPAIAGHAERLLRLEAEADALHELAQRRRQTFTDLTTKEIEE